MLLLGLGWLVTAQADVLPAAVPAPPSIQSSTTGTASEGAPAPQWSARPVDPFQFIRPELKARAEKEIPAGRSANIPALVDTINKLRPLAAAHPGKHRQGAQPWEPADVYEPSDEEILLSLSGYRIWRSLQLAPPGALKKIHTDNPAFKAAAVEYPHIEIIRVDVPGTSPRFYALAPVTRKLSLQPNS